MAALPALIELGDGEYVWSRHPDLIVLCGRRGSPLGCFRSGRELLARPDFRARYTLVEFEGRQPTSVRASVWVSVDGRIGAAIPVNGQVAIRLRGLQPSEWDIHVEGDGGPSAELDRGRLRVTAGAAAAHVRVIRLTPRSEAAR